MPSNPQESKGDGVSVADEINALLGGGDGGGGTADEINALLGGGDAPEAVAEKAPTPPATVTPENGFANRVISGLFGADPGNTAARARISRAADQADPERADLSSIKSLMEFLNEPVKMAFDQPPSYDEIVAAAKADPTIAKLLEHYEGVRTQSLSDIAEFRKRPPTQNPFGDAMPPPSYSNPLLDRGPQGQARPSPPPSEPLEYTREDVARAVWKNIGEIEGIGQAQYDAEHPFKSATADILGFAGPMLVGTGASKAVQAVSGAEKVAGLKGLASAAMRWGAFDVATQAQALFAGGQDDFDWQRLAINTPLGAVAEVVGKGIFPRNTLLQQTLPLGAMGAAGVVQEGKAAAEAGQPHGIKDVALSAYRTAGMGLLGSALHGGGKPVDRSPKAMSERVAKLSGNTGPLERPLTEAEISRIEKTSPPKQGFRRLFRGIGQNTGSGESDHGAYFTDNPRRAAKWGEVYYVDVPNSDLQPGGRMAPRATGSSFNDYTTRDPSLLSSLRPLIPATEISRLSLKEAPVEAAKMAEAAGPLAPEAAEKLSPFSTAEPQTLTEAQIRAKQAKLNKDVTWEQFVDGTLKGAVEKALGGGGRGKRVADWLFGRPTPKPVEQMNAELRGPWLDRLLNANEAGVNYQRFLDAASGGHRGLRDQIDRVVGFATMGEVFPSEVEIPVDVVSKGKELAQKAKDSAREAAKALQDAGMLAIGVYRLPDGSEVSVYKGEKVPEVAEKIRDYLDENYWPQLPGEPPGILKRIFTGRSGAQLSAKVLNAANNRLMHRTRSFPEHVAAGGETRFSKGFAEIFKEINAAHQKSQLDWLADPKNALIREKAKLPDQVEMAAGQQEMQSLRTELAMEGKKLSALSKALHTADTPEKKGRAMSEILKQHARLRDLRWDLYSARYMTTPQDWVELGPEWGEQYAGKYMRADVHSSLVERYREPGTIGAFVGGLTSVLSSNVTYKNFFGHFPRDYLSNKQQMSLGGTRPWSAAGIQNSITAWKQVVGELHGDIAKDPIFRAWFAEISGGGDRISGAGQFNERDLDASRRFFESAEAAATEGRDIVAGAHKLAGGIARMSEFLDKVPVVNLGAKYGRLSDVVPAYEYYRMLRTGQGSDFGYPMSHEEAMALHDAYFSYSSVAPAIRDISKWIQFVRFPVKQATSSLRYAATKPMRLGIPFTEVGKTFDFPILDRFINADPTSGKAQTAMVARMAINLGLKAASVVLPAMAVRNHQLSKLGITEEELDRELERDLAWAPTHVRGIMKALTIPTSKDDKGRINYIDLSDFVPWTALPKYLTMPGRVFGSNNRQSLWKWMQSKNLAFSFTNQAFGGEDFKGQPLPAYDWKGDPTRSLDRAWGAIQPLLPGVLAQAGQGAIRTYEMAKRGENITGLDVALNLMPVVKPKQTPGGREKESELGAKIVEYDKRGLLEQYTGEDGMKYFRIRKDAEWKDKREMHRAAKEVAKYYEMRGARRKREAAANK